MSFDRFLLAVESRDLSQTLRGFILQKVQDSVFEETEKEVLLPITQLGKEDTHIILLSA